MIEIISGIVLAFVICVILSPLLIPVLKKLKFGQQILAIGPKWHAAKSGTPTMGGIAFIIAITVTALIMTRDARALIVLGFAFACGVVGFIDDYIKVVLKRNMGFNVIQKTVFLIAAIVSFISISYYLGLIDTKIFIPFGFFEMELSYFYYPFAVIVIFATVNSVNLTDGIDGLASSVTGIVMIYFIITAFLMQVLPISLLAAAVLGGLLGFLVFNLYPAKVFMGDTGSLFLGGMVAGLAFIMENPLIIAIVGFVYLAESLSDIIQIVSFKMTGKRVFKMAPIHHHFEMSGFSENKIVTLFCLVTAALCVAGFFGTIQL